MDIRRFFLIHTVDIRIMSILVGTLVTLHALRFIRAVIIGIYSMGWHLRMVSYGSFKSRQMLGLQSINTRILRLLIKSTVWISTLKKPVV